MQECMSVFSSLQQGGLGMYANTIFQPPVQTCYVCRDKGFPTIKVSTDVSVSVSANVTQRKSVSVPDTCINLLHRTLTSTVHVWMPFEHLVRQCMYSQFWVVCSISLVLILVALLGCSRCCRCTALSLACSLLLAAFLAFPCETCRRVKQQSEWSN